MFKRKDTSWNKSSGWYNKIVGSTGHYYHSKLILPEVLKLLELKPYQSLADFGAGQGVLARSLPENVEYIGIDFSRRLIETAKKLDRNRKHSYVVSDLTRPLKLKNKVDVVVLILSLQNMQKISPVLKNAAENSTENGSVIIVLNHPCFRIPRQSGWTVLAENKLQTRWVAKYMSQMEIPIEMHPGKNNSEVTWSYHLPLESYVQELCQLGYAVTHIKEVVSDKESQGKAAKMENRSRSEIPLFMIIRAEKFKKSF